MQRGHEWTNEWYKIKFIILRGRVWEVTDQKISYHALLYFHLFSFYSETMRNAEPVSFRRRNSLWLQYDIYFVIWMKLKGHFFQIGMRFVIKYLINAFKRMTFNRKYENKTNSVGKIIFCWNGGLADAQNKQYWYRNPSERLFDLLFD